MPTSRPLRIAHVTFGLSVGGPEKVLVQFASHADPRRQHLTFISLGDTGPIGEELRELGWPVACLHRPTGFRVDLLAALWRLLRNVRADIVHTHDSRALIYGGPAARWAGIRRVIHTQHGQSLGLSPRQAWLLRRAARGVSHFVGVSDDVTLVAAKLGVPTDRLGTIRNGVDLTRFARTPSEIDRSLVDEPLVCVAHLSEEKGVSTLLKAVSLAVDGAPNLRLEIAGDGPQRAALESEAAQLHIADRVTFLGQVNDVPSLLTRARLFVLPSYSEGVSLTLLEAMAARTPVIATAVGGTPEVVGDEDTGVLVPAGDPRAMAAAIVRLWGDPLERERLAEAARLRVEQCFDVRSMLAKYDALYRGGAHSGRSPLASVGLRQSADN